jgi:hypothetical protein
LDVDKTFESCRPRLLVAAIKLGEMAGLASPPNQKKLQHLRRVGFDAGRARLRFIYDMDPVWWASLTEEERQQEALGAAFPAMVIFLLTELSPERR